MTDYTEVFDKAETAFKTYKKIPARQKAGFLRDIAHEIENLGEQLLETAHTESNLPIARLTGERGRTVGQIRLFADLVEEGSWLEVTIDTALPERTPLPRPDLRRMLFPIGPVLVFGASNFPLAFSTAGGDTISALAAGCPVIYKEHPGHVETSKLVASAIHKAIANAGLPEGIFQHVSGGIASGQELVKHPKTKAIAFTGSYKGGKAIFDLACQRENPIPVYAEMGSVNPIFVLPEKSKSDIAALAAQVSQSVLLGVGQFCTAPGLVFYPASEATEDFMDKLSEKLQETSSAKMLHEGICQNYYDGLEKLTSHAAVQTRISPESDQALGHAALAKVSGKDWLADTALQEEVFGPFTLVVTYEDMGELYQIGEFLQGQLTCTIWGKQDELKQAEDLVDILREKCGRLLFGGIPTGVEVSAAMTHGGPFPATTDSRSTSVGTYAIKRFARPITFQSAPEEILPEELKNRNSLSLWRTIDNQLSKENIKD